MTVTTTPARPTVAPPAATPDHAQRMAELRAVLAEGEAQRDALIGRVRDGRSLTGMELEWLAMRSQLIGELAELDPGAPALGATKAEVIAAAIVADARPQLDASHTCHRCGQAIAAGQGWEYLTSYPVRTPEAAKQRRQRLRRPTAPRGAGGARADA
ncbi:MAG TPA: hypothetical protein VFS21_09155 [Roseiflexaceae bacterium]|nr:hypothetical protein [Roseiflexaceae bacterium]